MKDLTQAPASAMRFDASVTVGTPNADGKANVPVSMLARSSKPIDHWWWGRVVHDMDGFTLSKPTLPIDYCHDCGEVLGYADKTTAGADGLTMSGALVPFGEQDRVAEILHKSAKGVPYEASINFGGDDTVFESIPEGYTTQVNGFDFAGPGVVIRKWTLRGVAICPYGADQNTATTFAAEKDVTFKLTRLHAGQKGTVMAQEADAKKDDKEELDDKAKGDATEETPPADDKKADDADDEKKGEKAEELSTKVDGAKAFTAAFGDRGAVYFVSGLSFEAAAAKFVGEQRVEHKAALAAKDADIAKLRQQVDAAKALSGNQPLPPSPPADGEQTGKPPKAAQGLSAGIATFAAGLSIPKGQPPKKK